jgi:hypothetical protein
MISANELLTHITTYTKLFTIIHEYYQLLLIINGYCWILVIILLMVIDGYSIGGYCIINYRWLFYVVL